MGSIQILAYPPSNFKAGTAKNSHFKSTKEKIIFKKKNSFCITRLNNIKLYKYNKLYINLTKDFLTDPSFLFLAYNQIKNKARNSTKIRHLDTFDTINKE